MPQQRDPREEAAEEFQRVWAGISGLATAWSILRDARLIVLPNGHRVQWTATQPVS